ncbi:hypothetical protein MTR67_017143, partial [Solanum verrucosum]
CDLLCYLYFQVGAVIVGLDQYINFYKLQYGTLCIRENPGCLFNATIRDAVGHLTDLQEWPGAGCMVAAICGTTQKEPITVGKPSTFLMDFLLQKYNITTSRMCMVGDRLDTDILFGQNAGCRTLLVFSGIRILSISSFILEKVQICSSTIRNCSVLQSVTLFGQFHALLISKSSCTCPCL